MVLTNIDRWHFRNWVFSFENQFSWNRLDSIQHTLRVRCTFHEFSLWPSAFGRNFNCDLRFGLRQLVNQMLWVCRQCYFLLGRFFNRRWIDNMTWHSTFSTFGSKWVVIFCFICFMSSISLYSFRSIWNLPTPQLLQRCVSIQFHFESEIFIWFYFGRLYEWKKNISLTCSPHWSLKIPN